VLPVTGPGVFSYWDYQQLAFPKKRGMRIDLVLGNEAFARRVVDARWTGSSASPRPPPPVRAPATTPPVVVDLSD
jgi:exodeoxyribonuclease-3